MEPNNGNAREALGAYRQKVDDAIRRVCELEGNMSTLRERFETHRRTDAYARGRSLLWQTVIVAVAACVGGVIGKLF